MSFSDDLEDLKNIVRRLEESSLPLEEALVDFERGVSLVRRCQRFLSEAEQKITVLTTSAEENPKEIPWEGEEGESLR
ncbi:exodeoxyribonuclease VII small subunit [Aminithiophilus ramosus]|uniref:Exodeoxyribonuclease 7 small subunit n=2 Tax=Synergistales TaxID=649776 RepID=A0A9Q7F036_9BACT|nr:exodeoxyribonuclease VII small subunit [Aminithiophilus ramosus]QTX33566.1 exodeoxyribonuclease VII small subunit [Aminithiophilus ramosus]QVL37420.1 exodeoxyribonuclease VII small subunit [Synergistota bacterium]